MDIPEGAPAIPAAAERGSLDDPELPHDPELVEEELLVEEISIDGMCGVY
jgi:mycofactocin precursor